jgi:hypothetical protein
MTNKFMDIKHEALIRYLNRLDEDFTGVQRIMHIFIKLKNEVMYDSIKKNGQLASETLIMGHGNNFSKNNLLCAILQLAGYECELRYKNVKDTTKWLFSKNGKVIPWYYVIVNYHENVLKLDCSFDRGFMSAARIVYNGDKLDYGLENYYFNEGQIFEVVSERSNFDRNAVKFGVTELEGGKLCI